MPFLIFQENVFTIAPLYCYNDIMKNYEYLIFDADHTVIDFDLDERRAFRAAFRAAGVDFTEEMVERAWAYSAKNWVDLGLCDVHLPSLRAQFHAKYFDHVHDIIQFIDEQFHLNGNQLQAREAFDATLELSAHYVDGADKLLQELSQEYKVCIATNGLSEMQHGRLREIKPFLSGLFISEEMGFVKPDPKFFEYILDKTGANREHCLMVGDSLSSDIAGANAVGMDCLWFNPKGAPLWGEYKIEGMITRLSEVKKFI